MATRKRLNPSGRARTAKRPIAVDRATAAIRKPSKPPLTELFYVAVDRQLKSGYGTYGAAETAALAIKTRHPQLHVTVYDAKQQWHTRIERPTTAGGSSPNRLKPARAG